MTSKDKTLAAIGSKVCDFVATCNLSDAGTAYLVETAMANAKQMPESRLMALAGISEIMRGLTTRDDAVKARSL